MSVRSEIDRINANISSTYDTLGSLGASLPATRNSDNLAAAAGSVKAVLYSYQDLTADQQTQVRNNIGVALPSGETSTITPQQVMNAVAEGRDVVIGHTHAKFGMLIFTSFIIASSLNAIVSSGTFALGGDVAVCQLYGDLSSNTWTCTVHEVAQLSDIPTALKNPNALTFKGAVSGTYDGSSAKTITIPTIAGEPGKTPVKGVDYFTAEDRAVIVDDVLAALDAAGVSIVVIDENNNIALSGVPDGDYTLVYENEDGSTTEICGLNVSDGTGTPDLPDVPDEPAGSTNLFVASTCTLNKRINSSNTLKDQDQTFVTDYIDIGDCQAKGGTNQIHFRNFIVYKFRTGGLDGNMAVAIGGFYRGINYYDTNNNFLGQNVDYYTQDFIGDANGDGVITLDATKTTATKIRICGAIASADLTSIDQLSNCIITLNELITD